MKTILSSTGLNSCGLGWSARLHRSSLALLLGYGAIGDTALAGVPEPDTVLYGSIALDGHGITAGDTQVVVELRGAPGGPVLASYRMGTSPAAGNRYVLRVKSESAAPLVESEALALGSNVYLTVLDATGTRDQRTYTLTARGTFVRIDFGQVDTDGDGMSDTFETTYFGSATGGDPNADPDHDGRPNYREALQGTNPLVADGQHPADLNPANWSLNIQEITEYALAWKLGTPWTIEPKTIPANYVTRAAALWVGGENYLFDNDPVTTAPLWWIQAPVVAAAAAGDPAGAAAEEASSKDASRSDTETDQLRTELLATARAGQAQGLAVVGGRKGAAPQSPRSTPVVQRVLPAAYTVNKAFRVTVNVEPGADTRAYAIEEAPPAGWLVRFVNGEGRFDSKNKKIKWGPYYGADARTLTYELTPISALAVARFDGSASFDGASVAVDGATAVTPPGATTPPVLEVVRATGTAAGLQLQLTAAPGASFVVEGSTDFSTWSEVGAVTTDGAGRAIVEAAGADNVRFFRLRAR